MRVEFVNHRLCSYLPLELSSGNCFSLDNIAFESFNWPFVILKKIFYRIIQFNYKALTSCLTNTDIFFPLLVIEFYNNSDTSVFCVFFGLHM